MPERTDRQRVSPGQLYAILNDEWYRVRPAGCVRCRMPLPVRLNRRPDEASANWRIGSSPWCSHRCDRVIVEIAARLVPRYDLVEE